MKLALIISILVYFLVSLFVIRKISNKQNKFDFFYDGSKVKGSDALWGFSASIFSTFALLGIPTFFARFGIMTYLFYSVAIIAMSAILLVVGIKIREKLSKDFLNQSIVGIFLSKNKRIGAFIYIGLISIVLMPYLIIQLKGISQLLENMIPLGNVIFWSLILCIVLTFYSLKKGIKAIFKTDVLQGRIFTGIILVITVLLFVKFGGFSVFSKVSQNVLSISGSHPVFSWQFLLVNVISFIIFPIIQPHTFTRIMAVKNNKEFSKMVLGFSVLGLIVGVCMFYVGSVGSLFSPDPKGIFLINLLKNELGIAFLIMYIIALLAAAMSTLDSLIFSLSSEWTILSNNEDKVLKNMKIVYGVLLFFVLMLSLFEIKSIVLFSLNSIVGSSMLLPLIFIPFTKSKVKSQFLMSIGIVSFVGYFYGVFVKATNLNSLVLGIYVLFLVLIPLVMRKRKEATPN